MRTMNFRMFKLDLEKAEEPEIKLPTSIGSSKKQENSRKTLTSFDCVDHNKLWNILKEMGIPDHLTCLLRNLYAAQEAAVKTGYAVYCHLAYLQSTSCEMLGRIKHTME